MTNLVRMRIYIYIYKTLEMGHIVHAYIYKHTYEDLPKSMTKQPFLSLDKLDVSRLGQFVISSGIYIIGPLLYVLKIQV